MALQGISISRLLARRRRTVSSTTSRQVTPRTDPRRAKAPPPPLPTTGGGGGPTPFLQTRAGILFSDRLRRDADIASAAEADERARIQHIRDLAIQKDEQAFQTKVINDRIAADAKIREDERKRVRAANINQLKTERQGTFAALMKSGDQARAVIFALGFGPENDVFDVRARALGITVDELKSAQALRTTTQEALSRVLDRQVTIGREGVRGLGSAVGAARSFIQGGADVRTLLQSAFGVGSLRAGERPGISAARLAELTSEVTPVGLL